MSNEHIPFIEITVDIFFYREKNNNNNFTEFPTLFLFKTHFTYPLRIYEEEKMKTLILNHRMINIKEIVITLNFYTISHSYFVCVCIAYCLIDSGY